MTLDVKKIKGDFPIFAKHPDLIYLDSAATSQKPKAVLDAEKKYYEEHCTNVRRGLYKLGEQTTVAYEGVRKKVADFIHARSEREIVFTSGTTASINLVAQGYLRKHIQSGNEIIVTMMEHHANFVPWQILAKQTGARLTFWDSNKEGELDEKAINKILTKQTKFLAITHVSNVLGTINQLKWITQKAHAVGCKVLVDAAQSVPHMGIDVEYLDADFLAFSGHKMLGPTGIGVLYAKDRHLEQMDPITFGGDMIREVHTTHTTWNDVPWKFEAGTPNIAGVIGLGAAIDYLKNIGLSNIREHEKQLIEYAISKLKQLSFIKLFGPVDAEKRSGVLSFEVDGVHPHDVAALLDQENIAVRAGHHCAMPLMERLKVPALTRASFYLYNDQNDIDQLVQGLEKVYKKFS